MSETSDNVLLCAKCELIRNFAGLPFQSNQKDEDAQLILRLVKESLGSELEDYVMVRSDRVSETGRRYLFEKMLLPDLVHSYTVMEKKETGISLLFGPYDHLAVRCFSKKEDLKKSISELEELAEQISQKSAFSRRQGVGFLTSEPSLSGTGLKCSVNLHLPLLAKQIRHIQKSFSEQGFRLSPGLSEGLCANADLYSLRLDSVAGLSCESILLKTTEAANRLALVETEEENKLLDEDRTALEDQIWRSYAALQYARKMDEKEFLRHWSLLRLGSRLSLLPVKLSDAEALIPDGLDGHLMARYHGTKDIPNPELRCLMLQSVLRIA